MANHDQIAKFKFCKHFVFVSDIFCFNPVMNILPRAYTKVEILPEALGFFLQLAIAMCTSS